VVTTEGSTVFLDSSYSVWNPKGRGHLRACIQHYIMKRRWNSYFEVRTENMLGHKKERRKKKFLTRMNYCKLLSISFPPPN